MNYRIYEPCKRVVSVDEKETLFSFPKMIFWKKDYWLHCGYIYEDIYKDGIIYFPKSYNINYLFQVCLGDFESSDLNEFIKEFWQTDFVSLENPNTQDTKTKAKLNLNTLELYDYETTNPEFAYLYLMYSKKRCSKLEDLIISIPRYAYIYASQVIKGRWIEAEKHIKMNSECSYKYAIDIIKGRWLECEETMKKSADYSCYYAINVMKERWLEAEDIIKKVSCYWKVYKNHFKLNEL